MGGFITSAARQARSNIRPLLLPPPSASQNVPPTLLKRIYDLLGVLVSVIILNYTAAPFIILNFGDSIYMWKVLGWYGHIIIMGSLVFFYAGGTKFFRNLQKAKGVLPPPKKSVNGATNGTSSGTATPVSEKVFTIPPSIDKVIPPPK